MGYDDDPRFASSDPLLTTIRVPIHAIAREGTRRLLVYLKAKNFRTPFIGHTLFPVHLIERQSVRNLTQTHAS